MRINSIMTISLALLIPTVVLARAQPTASSFEIFPGNQVKVIDSEIIKLEKNLTYEALKKNNPAMKNQIASAEAILQQTRDSSRLTKDDIEARGRLLSKIGAFYVYTLHKPDLGIAKMKAADVILTENYDKSWNYNYIANAYEAKYAVGARNEDKMQSLHFISKAISVNQDSAQLAFGNCVKGKLFKDDYNSETHKTLNLILANMCVKQQFMLPFYVNTAFPIPTSPAC